MLFQLKLKFRIFKRSFIPSALTLQCPIRLGHKGEKCYLEPDDITACYKPKMGSRCNYLKLTLFSMGYF